jgi:5-methylcytosine-specific restriction endonuclease McrA
MTSFSSVYFFFLLKQSRRIEAVLVAHIGEVDARRLYIREAGSMFGYCTQVLHLSEHESYTRIAVARASRRYPRLLAMLADGRLHLSGIVRLVPHLTDANCEHILACATHLTKNQIEELVAEIAPKPDVPATVIKLPQRVETSAELGRSRADLNLGAGPGEIGQGGGATPAAIEKPATKENGVSHGTRSGTSWAVPVERGLDRVASVARCEAPARSPEPAAAVTPLSPGRYKVQFTASAELRDKLERLRALTREDLVTVVEAAVTERLARLEAKRFALAKSPRKSLDETDTRPSSRYIPAAVRRLVRRRDGGRCTFVTRKGVRCTERRGLEFHHRRPYGHGGGHSPENVCLLCRQHNVYAAELDYGKDRMNRYRRAADRVSEASPAYGFG